MLLLTLCWKCAFGFVLTGGDICIVYLSKLSDDGV